MQVRQEREDRGWTQERLRKLLLEQSGIDLSATAMARLEQGKRPIRLNEVAALAQLLELELNQYAGMYKVVSDDEYEAARAELEQVLAEEQSAEIEFGRIRREHSAKESTARGKLIYLARKRGRLESAIWAYEEKKDG